MRAAALPLAATGSGARGLFFFFLSLFSLHRWISFFPSSQAAIGFTSSPPTIGKPTSMKVYGSLT